MKIPIEMPVGTIQILILLVFHSSSSPYSDGVCKYIAWNCENFACFSARSQLRMAPHLTNSSKKKETVLITTWFVYHGCVVRVFQLWIWNTSNACTSIWFTILSLARTIFANYIDWLTHRRHQHMFLFTISKFVLAVGVAIRTLLYRYAAAPL